MRKVWSVGVGVLIAAAWFGSAAATPPVEPVPEPSVAPAIEPATTVDPAVVGPEALPTQVPPLIVDPNIASAPLVVVPASCFAPPAPVAVFVGFLIDADSKTGRFAVQQIRAGSLDGYAVDTIVDVRYDDDIRFLRAGQQYLVGAAPDPNTSALHSKVRLQAPLFGGDAVIDVDDTDVRCPLVEDGVKTLLVAGTDVDTGVLAPLMTAKKSLLKAILKPLGIAFVALMVLVSIKLLVFAMVRAVREPTDSDPPIPYDRQHVDA